MTMLKSRLARLEYGAAPAADDPFGLDDLTDERLKILRYDLAWTRRRHEDTADDERADAARRIAQTEREIRETAAGWVRYPAHRQQVLSMWDGARGAVGELVLPIIDCGMWWSWDKPKRIGAEMRWRRETRARPEIARLIAEGEAMAARQAETTARPGITAAVVRVAPPPVEVPPIRGCSAGEPFAPALIPIAYPTATPARGSFAVDYDPYKEFRPR
jgi:hypothetical protein